MKFLKIVSFLLLLCIQALAQKIQMYTSDNSPDFKVEAIKSEDEFKIIYMRKDTTDGRKVYAEMEKMGISIQLVAQNFGPLEPEERKEKSDAFFAMVERHTHYIKDSLQFKAHTEPEFSRTFEALIHTSEERLNQSNRPKNTFVVDGVSFSWIITKDSRIKTVYADSPNEKTHPILYQYISSIVGIYRKRKSGELLDRFPYWRK